MVLKVSKDRSGKNRSDILNSASIIMRRDGFSAASIEAIASHANLTHGAVYRHFPSKKALAVAALEHDFARIVDLIARLKAEGAAVHAYGSAYLASDHRDHFLWGCPVGALVSEMHRHPLEIGAAFTEGLVKNIDALAELLGTAGTADPEVKSKAVSKAIAILALMAGALSMARAVSAHDADLSARIMASAMEQIDRMSL